MSIEMLTVKALAPLALHQRRASEQFAPTLDYIPGSAVRGAFADLYLAGHPARAREPIFQRLFGDSAERAEGSPESAALGPARFSDLFPTETEKGELVRLRPATAVACKRFPDEHAAGLADGLLRLELQRDHPDAALPSFEQWMNCPQCRKEGLEHGKRDRAAPRYYGSVENPQPVRLDKRMIANTAIRRRTQTAAHTMLFSHEVIEESSPYPGDGAGAGGRQVWFRGAITLPADLRLTLQSLAPPGQEIAVGYGRSRGFGLLRVECWATPDPEGTRLQERWAMLNQAAQRLWQTIGREPDGQYFTITLSSHLALQDQAGQPILGTIQAPDLGLPAAIRGRCVMNAVVNPGWNMTADMPKADTWALGRGSVLLFRLPPNADPGPTLARLEEIEQEGVGLRRAEGFGSVIVCDPFHYHFTLDELGGS